MIQIYFGYGKGKTTSALGQGMRAKGAGKNVLLVQFLKNNKSSELAVLPFDIFKSPEKSVFFPFILLLFYLRITHFSHLEVA